LPLIAIEGIDKAGKGTQARILAGRLSSGGLKVEHLAFPDYQTPLGREIKRFLAGKVALRPEVRQLLFVANRWEREADIRDWLAKGVFVIADRYTPSGLVYGLANGLDLRWMLKIEEGLPQADLVIVLDVSPEVASKRGGIGDIYEQDISLQGRVRTLYLELGRVFNWEIVDGEKTINDVALDVWRTVSRRFSVT
jgi:dTMP kinase